MDPTSIRDEKVKLLRSVMAPRVEEAETAVVRAQYQAGVIDGQHVPGYREEEGVDPQSQTETFVAMRLSVDNWRWAGVPVFIRTGKRLAKRSTEVAMVFQRPPHLPFAGKLVRGLQPNALILRIQPDEGITLRFGAKVPGQDYRVRTVAMDFSYKEAFGSDPPDAYERLLLDAMIGDPTLFIRTDEVEQAWRLLEPVQEAFAEGYPHLSAYAAGTLGPARGGPALRARRLRVGEPLGVARAVPERPQRGAARRRERARRFRRPRRCNRSAAGPGAAEGPVPPRALRRRRRHAPCYEELAGRTGLDWGRVECLVGDERCVAADDPDANQAHDPPSAHRARRAASGLFSHGL